MGRSQVNLSGKRTDFGVTSNSLTRSDIMNLPAQDTVNFSDFLPNSMLKNSSKKNKLFDSSTSSISKNHS